jgi:cytochrome b561
MNEKTRYGLVSILLHWIIAILTIGLFGLGVWMVELDYYHSWYQRAPWWHKNIGVVVVFLIVVRWIWQCVNPSPAAEPSISAWQVKIAHGVHFLMNLLVLTIGITGYLIVTAKGKGLMVFDWFQLPALISNIANLEDKAGELHWLFAYLLIGLVLLHTVAAFVHHYIYRDKTLTRMLGFNKERRQRSRL